MKIFIEILSLLCLFSCGNKVERKAQQIIMKWQGREIIFPQDTSFVSYSRSGEKVFHLKDGKYKIFSYVDSVGCMSCKLRLDEWGKFIYTIDSISQGSVPFIFVFQPKKRNELVPFLKRTGFRYPLFVDSHGCFEKLNHFPTGMDFQTFLLDKDNKVLAIGNPILNPKVKELYLKIIQGKPLQDDSKDKQVVTTVSLESTVLSMGDFAWQEERQGIFRLKNTGEKPLVIQDVVTSCGCLTVDYPQEPVMPGKEAVLRVTYKADSPGYFNKVVTVYCNTEDAPIKLWVSGNAVK